MPMGERQPLLPSYSPSVARLRRDGLASAAPAWPATFEEGVDARMASPASMVRTPRSPFVAKSPFTVRSPFTSPYMDRQRILDKQKLDAAVEEAEVLEGHSSFKDGAINAINVLLGIGVLSSPFALRSSGWLLGIPLFFFFMLVTNHTAKLLGKCLDFQEGMQTYPDIGEAAYGTKGRVIISITFFLELFTLCAMLFIVIGDTLAALIPSYNETQLTVVAFLLILPTLWTTQMSKLSYFSIIGFISSLFCLYTVLYVGFATDVAAPGFESGSLLHPQPVEVLADADRIPLAIGLTMVAFGGHSVFPSICSSLENKANYPRVVDVAYVVACAVYGVIELAGYLMYGVGTKKEITLNLIASYPGTLTTLVVWTIVLNPLSKIAISIHPIALAFEEFLLSRQEMVSPTSRKTAFYRAFIRSSIGVASVFCALYVPYFARLTSFLGAFFSMMVSLFFPCIFYLKLFWRRLSRFEIALNVTLAVLSIIFTVIGTIASFVSPAE